eukprot:760446-Alexandrium_andersonii.AAC.1
MKSGAVERPKRHGTPHLAGHALGETCEKGSKTAHLMQVRTRASPGSGPIAEARAPRQRRERAD